jgi:leucine dehydrogenase
MNNASETSKNIGCLADFENQSFEHLKIIHHAKLKATLIVAIHQLKNGFAIGGCRLNQYYNLECAVQDALKLSYAMSLKSAIHQLSCGGAKAVVMMQDKKLKTKALIHWIADVVNQLNGQYVTAVDMGVTSNDMQTIAEKTPYVIATENNQVIEPAYYTALGVFHAICGALKFKHGRTDLHKQHIAIHGAGQVGMQLMKILLPHQCKISIFDRDPSVQSHPLIAQAKASWEPSIFSLPCDVLVPCSVGGMINPQTTPMIKTGIIVSAANNPHQSMQDLLTLHEQGTCVVPDFLANGGGLIAACSSYLKQDVKIRLTQIQSIEQKTYDLLKQSHEQNIPPQILAEKLALQSLSS